MERQQELSHTPIGCTTDETLMRDLDASQMAAFLKQDFEDRNLCIGRSAERLATLCVSILDPSTYDAAAWKAAERLYHFMDGRADALPLSSRELPVRALYLTMAINALASFRLALEGGFGVRILAQAHADICNHREQLASRVPALRVVEGGR